MTPDPKQLAREMAEKCAMQMCDAGLMLYPLPHNKPDLAVKIILQELNLEQLIADKQRLEFRLKRQEEILTYVCNIIGNDLISQIDKEADEKVGEGIVPLEHIIEAAIKQRIDNAMKEEQK